MLGMGSPCLRSLVCWSRNSLVLSSRQIHQSSRLSESYPVIPMELSHGSSQLIRCSRTSFDDYQDFQGYAKPLRLLPASKPHIFTKSPLEDMSSYFGVDGSEPTYTVKLRTSSIFGSCLSSMDAGILLCLIDENGDSILQRLPVSIPLDDPQIKEAAFPDPLPFQRDSVDIFTFGGHKLGKLKALWVGLESG
ncbi:hypothetical protein GIB67_019773 [Kingdonia uniflora]|uniref:DUF7755 domain-containing protein n=1 Tax=Kingdonia uniflora TaxID=39325 RepID=A0A7J7MK55_9MAGN|nr:hypothetical protein GIB67_019773 [Kingdonia uniflora]